MAKKKRETNSRYKVDFDYLNKLPGIKNAIIRFFVCCYYAPRPNPKKASFWNCLSYLIKVRLADIFFRLGPMSQDLVSFLTRYYPFSLFWQDKLYHARNTLVRNWFRKFEDVSDDAGIPIRLYGGHEEGQMSELEGEFLHNKRPCISAMQELETLLQAKYGSIYVRKSIGGIKLLVPVKLLETYPDF